MTEKKSNKLPQRPVEKKFTKMQEARRIPTTTASAPKNSTANKKS